MNRIAYVLLSILLGGCCSYTAADFTPKKASTLIDAKSELDGFTYAARLPESKEWEEYQESHYCSIPTENNILPVEIYLENTGSNSDYNVLATGSAFALADGTEFDLLTLDEVVDELGCSGWITAPWWLFAIFPGAIALAGVNNANEAMADDYESKMLEDLRVPVGGAPVHGVLFFRPRKGYLEDMDLYTGTLSLDVAQRSRDGSAGDRKVVTFAITK